MRRINFLPAAAAVCFVFSVSGAASAEVDYTPAPTFNGAQWNKLEKINPESCHMMKVCLVRGIYEGAYAMDPQNAYQQYGAWLAYGEVVRILDSFYRDPTNQKIPVTYALVLTASEGKIKMPSKAQPPIAGGRPLVSMESH